MDDLIIKSTGAIESPKDYRDIPYGAVIAAAGAPISRPVSFFVPVEDLPVDYQRNIGACVGHAAAKYKQRLERLETAEIIKLSPRYLYALAKCRDGVSGEGTYPRLVAKILKDEGCATEATIPNDTTLDHESYVYGRKEADIPAEAKTEGKKYAIKGYAFPDTQNANELKDAIINSNGAMLLMNIGEEWWTTKDGTASSWDSKEIIPLRAPKAIVSGHEVYLYGYEDTEDGRTKFYIFNSWSVRWGLSGKAWFYYDEYKSNLREAITFIDLPNTWADTLKTLPTAETFKHTFTTPLSLGQRSEEVKNLQIALMIDGEFSRDLFTELFNDNALGYYGAKTAGAVFAFQAKYKLAPSSELISLGGRSVGPKTRAQLNALYAPKGV